MISSKEKYRTLIADDEQLTRDRLKRLLFNNQDFGSFYNSWSNISLYESID